jgi:hypothetical protein
MVVYKLVGRTAPLDWAAMAEDKTLGLYKTMAAAHRALDVIQARKDWRMDWSHFTIVEEKVLE